MLGNDIYVMGSKVKKLRAFGKLKKEKIRYGFKEGDKGGEMREAAAFSGDYGGWRQAGQCEYRRREGQGGDRGGAEVCSEC
ncbi:hypothetical protein ACFX14_014822 [Malus domestica]